MSSLRVEPHHSSPGYPVGGQHLQRTEAMSSAVGLDVLRANENKADISLIDQCIGQTKPEKYTVVNVIMLPQHLSLGRSVDSLMPTRSCPLNSSLPSGSPYTWPMSRDINDPPSSSYSRAKQHGTSVFPTELPSSEKASVAREIDRHPSAPS